MTTISKYELRLGMNEQTEIVLPEFACPLSVHQQNGAICMWMKVDTSQHFIKRYFSVVGTGWDLDDREVIGPIRMFIGTVLIDSRAWHVFEVSPK